MTTSDDALEKVCNYCGGTPPKKPPTSRRIRSWFVRGVCWTPCYDALRQRGELDKYADPPFVTQLREVGSRMPTKDGYVSVKLEDGRIILEHRAVMEGVLGRKLAPGETVHHLNGIRDDNRPENLELWFNQPYGQRIPDLIEYLATYHRDSLELALGAHSPATNERKL